MFFAISSSEFQEACALAQSDRISTFANPETINQFIEDKGLYPCHLCCQSSSAVSFITITYTYSNVSIIRPGSSRLLEFEKRAGQLIENFSKYPDQVV